MPDVNYFVNINTLYLHQPYASLLNGIIFGIELKTLEEFFLQLKKVGLLHIVVLSGMNISLLSAFVSRLTIRFGRYISSLFSIIAIICFVLFVGPEAPIVRAGIMAIIAHVAIIYGFKTYSLYLLFLSAVISLLVKPDWLMSISFQLSYFAVLGIVLFSKSYKRVDGFINNLIRDLKIELRTSLSAQVFTSPLIFLYFKEFSLISPISNLLTAGLIAPIMILGFLSAFLGSINYYLGLPFAWLAYGLLRYLVFVIEVLANIPFGFFDFK